MSKKSDIRVCRYDNCPHGKTIDISIDDYKVVNGRYYHSDCLKEKQKGGWKDKQTKADLQYIKNQWNLHISDTVVYSQLFKCLNELLLQSIPSDYLVFVMDYVVKNNMKLRYPAGFKYYVDNDKIKEAYKKSKLKKVDINKFTTNVDELSDLNNETNQKPIFQKPKGFGNILKNK